MMDIWINDESEAHVGMGRENLIPPSAFIMKDIPLISLTSVKQLIQVKYRNNFLSTQLWKKLKKYLKYYY